MTYITYIALLLAILLAFLVALFAVQNTMAVQVTLMKWTIETSLVLVILAAASLGFGAALFLQVYSQVKLRFQLYKAQSHSKLLEQQLAQLQGQLAAAPDASPALPQATTEQSESDATGTQPH